MVRINQDEIDAVRNAADIVDIIGRYIQVQRKGKDYVALCPFHDDHSPSMSISPEKQIYKCFVCGNGGNVFTFVQNYEKISFPEAVGRVAEMIGYHLSVQPDKYQAPADPHKQKLYAVLNETIRFTMYQMDTAEALQEKEYLDKRGLNEKCRETFQIGYDPQGEALTKYLTAKGYEEKDLTAANVTRVNEHGTFDVFGGRITFPIHDAHGNPIGFSARTIDPENTSKYINTNDTDIFTKGDIVYNYHRARNAARHEGKLYVCEGVTDVIAFWRAGMENAVCTLGTSCTENQIHLLKHAGAHIVFCYDGDHAGQAATWRAAEMAKKAGCSISIVLNKTGKDPDEIIRDQGADALKQMVSQEISWMEFVLKYLSENTNMESYLEKKEMVKKAQAQIEELPDQTDREYFTQQLSSMTGFHIAVSSYQPEKTPIQEPVHRLKVPDGTQQAEEQILAMMMAYPEAAMKFEEELGFLISKDGQTAAMMILEKLHDGKSTDPASLIDATEDQNVKNLISRLADYIHDDQEYEEKKLAGAIRRIRIDVLEDEFRQYKEQLASELNSVSAKALLEKMTECAVRQRRLMDEEDSEKKQ
jgi:DNA primase